MVRSQVLLSTIFATLGVALAGCGLSRGYFIRRRYLPDPQLLLRRVDV